MVTLYKEDGTPWATMPLVCTTGPMYPALDALAALLRPAVVCEICGESGGAICRPDVDGEEITMCGSCKDALFEMDSQYRLRRRR